MKKICTVTGTRAEYGLLYWVMKGIEQSASLQLQLAVTGMHLSPEFGLTYKVIEQDGFAIDAKVEILLSSDTPVGIAKSISLGVSGFADVFARLSPDMALVLGDRYEMLAAVQAAYVMGIPIAHIAGGETTEGAIDEGMRHAITKMSWLHFVSAEPYRKRVIQLGEDPKRVFCTGSTGLDYLTRMKLLSREELQKELGFSFGRPTFLVTYHPATLGEPSSTFAAVLHALDRFPEASIIFTYPNSDANGRVIISMIEEYVAENENRCRAFVSLGQLRYLSALSQVDLVLGNSSSGLTEAPSFKVPTINVGDRQKGRLRANSVIDTTAEGGEIAKAIRKALSSEFKEVTAHTINPYGEGNASDAIVRLLESINLGERQKVFYNIEFNRRDLHE